MYSLGTPWGLLGDSLGTPWGLLGGSQDFIGTPWGLLSNVWLSVTTSLFYYCWQLLGGLISLKFSICWVPFYYCWHLLAGSFYQNSTFAGYYFTIAGSCWGGSFH